ncbi:hypothetical protein E5288_WYG020526 [Bos mutus]|uniref:Exonuclease domain-containing protein n=1 Tax=Bos mutus TaxID=72004 RepID=A0A6B0RQZ3_9CETA|nr:hypothetical protein [Bos mutus]
MEQLERIDKEIKSVKTEVEEKQKMLPKFTLALEELSQSPMVSLSDTNVKQGFPENSLLPQEKWNEPSKNKESQPTKYMMDHTCPATDLEYDPLLNYSVALLGASKGRQGETDRQPFWKKSVGKNCHKSLESQRPYVSPIRIKINLQDSDEDDLVMDVPPIIPVSRKSKRFRGFKYQNMEERIQVVPPEERNLQISGIEEEKTGETQLTAHREDDSNKLELSRSLMKTSLDAKTKINTCGDQNHISKMGSFGGEKMHVCISGENISYAPPRHKEIQTGSHSERYPKRTRHVKTDDTQKEETEWLSSPSQLQFSYSDDHLKDKVLTAPDDSQDLTIFEDSSEFTQSQDHEGETAKQASGKQMELDMLYYQNISGPKRRIAHTAKVETQQQVVQMMTAVKDGQAFDPATSEQKKNTFVCPASQSQRKALGENSCTSSSLQEDVVPSKENPVAKPNRSHIPVKTIASFPVKDGEIRGGHRKQALGASESAPKVPDEVRRCYVNLFFDKYLKVYKTEDEAFKKAKTEEKVIYEHCSSQNMYVNIAINTLKKLRDQDMSGSNNDNKTTGLKKNETKNGLTGIMLYRHLKDYLLTEEQLRENNYPQPNPEKPGSILLNPGMTKTRVNDPSRKTCCRCGKIYGVTSTGRHSRTEECHYHFGRVLSHKVLGGLGRQYSCCKGVLGSPGCQVAKHHVHNQKENLGGFVKTLVKFPALDRNPPRVFAVSCEVCYTAKGLEPTRVTVVDPSLQVVYDTFVKPDEEVIDYNTRFSGVAEDDLKNMKTSVRDVQAILLNLFSADTILIGHSFEHSLYALKLIHTSVVDTTVLFPHPLGLPHRRSLKGLVADYLQRVIQDEGHSSSENATACMELVLWKVNDDLKGKK